MSVSSTRPVRSAIAVAALRAASSNEADPTVANPDHLARHFVNGFRFDQPCFFIFEGVSYYLQEHAAKNLFKFVGQHCAKGSSIAFYVVRIKMLVKMWIRLHRAWLAMSANRLQVGAYVEPYE
jgi:O-methyltransferase involved in polyketide biosynthesis